MAGSDSNWGRIIMAIGKSGVKVDSKNISIKFGGNIVVSNGQTSKNFNLKKVNNYLKKNKIDILVKMGSKKNISTVWTCDLTNDYISINADYRS